MMGVEFQHGGRKLGRTYRGVRQLGSHSETFRRAPKRIGVAEGADYEERHQIILREAARAFVENGTQNTSLDDVATRVGVTKPALYHYVSSKDELISQVLDIAAQEKLEMLDDIQAEPVPGRDRLRRVCELWATSATTDFGRAVVLIERYALSPQSLEKYLDVHRKILRRIESLIRDGVADGSIRNCNPAVMALGLMGVFNSPARWYRPDGPMSLDAAVQQLVEFMEHGVVPQAS